MAVAVADGLTGCRRDTTKSGAASGNPCRRTTKSAPTGQNGVRRGVSMTSPLASSDFVASRGDQPRREQEGPSEWPGPILRSDAHVRDQTSTFAIRASR